MTPDADGPSIEARLLDEAAQWLARMHAPDFSAAEQAALARWCGQSPVHRRVWQSAERLDRRFDAVPPALGMAVLNRPRSAGARRTVLKAVAVLLVAPPAVWLAQRSASSGPGTTYRTATGERRDVALADGSRMTMNTASAVDVAFDASQRLIRLVAGEALFQTAPDAAPVARPFIVRTAQGSLRARGTRFIVRREKASTALIVREGVVEVRPRDGGAGVFVGPGQQFVFTATACGPVVPAPETADAWTFGVLYAEDMRLADFAAQLSRYRRGILQCDPAVADLHVTGAFQLEDTDRVLRLLAQSLPVRVDFRTRYWVTIAGR